MLEKANRSGKIKGFQEPILFLKEIQPILGDTFTAIMLSTATMLEGG